MSSEELTRFTKDVESNSVLKDEVLEKGNDLNKIVSYAKAKGYNLTEEDFNLSHDISDEELDGVAGGKYRYLYKSFVVS